jgi:segregation and condensation protein B
VKIADNRVELGTEGELVNFAVVRYGGRHLPKKPPYILGQIRLDGADTPLTPARIVDIVGTGSARDVRNHIETLNRRYEETGASFRIEKLAGGYQMLTLPAFNAWLKRLKQARQESKLSQAAMETLAVVAYKQPVVRAEIEAIRGVAAGEMLNRLRELGLIKIVGRAEELGRPMLYGTTKRFLEVFGLADLSELPQVEELRPPDAPPRAVEPPRAAEAAPPAPEADGAAFPPTTDAEPADGGDPGQAASG